MATITQIYDAVESSITTALSGYQTLNNPYRLENNAEITFHTAYGIAVSDGSNLNGNEQSGHEQRTRNFVIHLTRRKFATSRDATARENTEKALLEDWTTLLNAWATNPTLRNATVPNTGIQRAYYESDGGIEFVSLDKSRDGILVISTVLTVEYEASVTAPSP